MQDVIQFFQTTLGVSLLIFLAYFPLVDFMRRLYLYEFTLYNRLEKEYKPIIKYTMGFQTIAFIVFYIVAPYFSIQKYMVDGVTSLLILPVVFFILTNMGIFTIYGLIHTGKLKVTLKDKK
ncbi:hypothetical protein [Bacillus toyonensis]|uniref:hypothetical protein n=1 Tax=Bacillus toyonensis TaxID=155322 RepID=UPI000BF3E90E|nr:hypothetical protein [Bacillus toyonensis]PGF05115.1 hypothetical protein COM61_01425 [Bacillus toyonensis]